MVVWMKKLKAVAHPVFRAGFLFQNQTFRFDVSRTLGWNNRKFKCCSISQLNSLLKSVLYLLHYCATVPLEIII